MLEPWDDPKAVSTYVQGGVTIWLDRDDLQRVRGMGDWYQYTAPGGRTSIKLMRHASGSRTSWTLQNFLVGVPIGQHVKFDFVNGNSHDYRRCNLRRKGKPIPKVA